MVYWVNFRVFISCDMLWKASTDIDITLSSSDVSSLLTSFCPNLKMQSAIKRKCFQFCIVNQGDVFTCIFALPCVQIINLSCLLVSWGGKFLPYNWVGWIVRKYLEINNSFKWLSLIIKFNLFIISNWKQPKIVWSTALFLVFGITRVYLECHLPRAFLSMCS